MPQSPFNAFFLWTDQSEGAEHNFLEQRHLIPYTSRCRGQIDIFKEFSLISKYRNGMGNGIGNDRTKRPASNGNPAYGITDKQTYGNNARDRAGKRRREPYGSS